MISFLKRYFCELGYLIVNTEDSEFPGEQMLDIEDS